MSSHCIEMVEESSLNSVKLLWKKQRKGVARNGILRKSPRLSTRTAGSMADISEILSALDRGDPQAAAQLLPLVYDELRRLAAQKLEKK